MANLVLGALLWWKKYPVLLVTTLKCGFGICYGIGRKYWPIWVSVLVLDLNQNSGFGRTLIQAINVACITYCQFFEKFPSIFFFGFLQENNRKQLEKALKSFIGLFSSFCYEFEYAFI